MSAFDPLRSLARCKSTTPNEAAGDIALLSFVALISLGSTACSQGQDELERASACTSYLYLSAKSDPSSDPHKVVPALERARDTARALSVEQTGSEDRRHEIGGRTIREMAERFGTSGGDSPELVAFLRDQTAECVARYSG
jgi:hypothetical protein